MARTSHRKRRSSASADHIGVRSRRRPTSHRDQLVAEHLWTADTIASRFRRPQIPASDLSQVALMALVAAAERFDPALGYPFSAFARRTVEGELRKYLRDRTWMVRPPRRDQGLLLEVRASQEALSHALCREPTTTEVARDIKADSGEVSRAIAAAGSRSADSIEAPHASSPASSSDPGFDRVESRIVVAQLLATLADNERLVLRRLYLEGRTQAEVADELDRSQSYVSRVADATLRRLRVQVLH